MRRGPVAAFLTAVVVLVLAFPTFAAQTSAPLRQVSGIDAALVFDTSVLTRDIKRLARAWTEVMNPEYDQAAVFSFGEEGNRELRLTSDPGRVAKAIDDVKADPIARMARGIDVARDELRSSRHREGNVRIMLIFSDGNNEDPDQSRRSADRAKDSGIIIYTLGVGDRNNDRQMRRIASGNERYIEDPSREDIHRIYEENAPSARATATPVATATPTALPLPTIPPVPPPNSIYFRETGFAITNPWFQDFFLKRGGLRTFGYPVSREFQFLGFNVQFFQRAILQLKPEGGVTTVNLLDPGFMPYTQINGSTFPAVDPALVAAAPVPNTPNYDSAVIDFVRANAPDNWNGLPTNFYTAFLNTVRYEDAFPQGGGDPNLIPLLNLELWGVPTSRPQFDPNNRNFVYLRFQRGIMHYDASTGVTQALLLADYFKAILTGQNLPADLDAAAQGSRFYRQYSYNSPIGVARPQDLPGTNMLYAFERQGP